MSNNFYGDFTIEEADDIGKKFVCVCRVNVGYENSLTVGKQYTITMVPRILALSPVCSFIGDNKEQGTCHIERFKKV